MSGSRSGRSSPSRLPSPNDRSAGQRAARTDPTGWLVTAAWRKYLDDVRSVDETDWVQIVEWYDELLALTDSPVVRLNRAVAVGQADGASAGLAALADVDPSVPRYCAAAAFLREMNGEFTMAAQLYAEAAGAATNLAEREHLTRQAARLNEVVSFTRPTPH